MRDERFRPTSSSGADDDGLRYATVLGVRFLDAPVESAIARLARGGLMVVPSGPGLATLPDDPSYRDALVNSDFAIVDSGYLALLWFAATGHRLHRVSGLKFLRAFLGTPDARTPGALFLVNPCDEDAAANLRLLHGHGFAITEADCYTAPRYRRNQIEDPSLVACLEARRPRYVMLNVGGGIQEPLGWYLRQRLTYAPGIICTGAAIAFLTGRQATIPEWVDATALGWLARSLANPRTFLPRYAGAVKLAGLVHRYRDALPALREP